MHETASVAFSEFLDLEQAGNILEFLYSVSAYQETFEVDDYTTQRNVSNDSNDMSHDTSCQSTKIKFKEPKGHTSKISTKEDAMGIYSRFISPQSKYRIGFSDTVRKEIEERICVKADEYILDNAFDPAEKQALMTLNSVYFPAFRTSTTYTHFLQDLLRGCRLLSNDEDKNTNLLDDASGHENGHSANHDNNLRSSRSSSSDDYLSRTNSQKFSIHWFKNSNISKNNTLDYYEEQLNNPDILWYRSNMAKVYRSIGYVDSLGRFSIDNDLIAFNKAINILTGQINPNDPANRSASGRPAYSGQNDPDLDRPEHLKVEKMDDYNSNNSYYNYLGLNKVFKKFVGVSSPSEEQELAASVAREFLNNLLLSQKESFM